MHVHCGLCGQKAHQLFEHVRELHSLSPEHYLERCPGAPLISEELAGYLAQTRIVTEDGRLRKLARLFGVEFTTDLVAGPRVPEVDPEYILPKKLSRRLLLCLKAGERVLLVGETGIGKSTLVEQLAARLNWPVVRVAASGGLTESDLVGEWTVRQGETVFNYGFLPRAMRAGAVCLVDEVDGMEPEVAFALHQLMEDEGRLVLLQNGGEVIEPDPDFRLVCTANTLGHGDETGLYTGTRVLNAAFLDRFAAVFRMSYLPPHLERRVLAERAPGCPEEVLGKLVRAAGQVRKARENEEIYSTFSTRRLIELARKVGQLGELGPALELAVLNRLPEADRKVVWEIFQRHLGDRLEGGADAIQ
ncbi:MAG: AAA family ATPase [Planctomycetota bacterium]